MKLKYLIPTIIIFLSFATLSSCVFFEKEWDAREKAYYAVNDNYVVLSATVIASPTYFEEEDYYLLNVEFDDKKTVQYEDRVKINKLNGDVLEQRGYFKEISEGDEIQITLAPEIFGDGYIIPAVGISAGEKIYLDFETGKVNLMATYE